MAFPCAPARFALTGSHSLPLSCRRQQVRLAGTRRASPPLSPNFLPTRAHHRTQTSRSRRPPPNAFRRLTPLSLGSQSPSHRPGAAADGSPAPSMASLAKCRRTSAYRGRHVGAPARQRSGLSALAPQPPSRTSAPQPPRCLQRSGPSVLQPASLPALRPASTPALQPPVLQLPSTPARHRSRIVGAVIATISVPNGVRARRARPCLPPRGSHSRAGKANDLGSLPPARRHVSARVLAPAPFQRARFCHRAAHPPPAGFIFGHRCSPQVRAFTLRPCVSAPVPARTQHRPRADPRQLRDCPALNFSTTTHAVCSWHRSPSPSHVANC